jgi:carnitine 3-dehydrogenase
MASSQIRKAACIGAGVIGSAWAARLAWNGIDVTVYDPHPEAEPRLREVLANAERAQAKLTMAPVAKRGTVSVVREVAEAVADAEFIQESAPEREDLKIKLLAEVDAHCRPDVIIGSSTSGLLPSKLQVAMKHPDRFLVGHPFNPVYLMPLVEVVGGEKTSLANVERAMTFYRSIGMHPLHVRKEIDAFIADRLMEALWREALWLVKDGVATAEEIDDAVRFGPGLRWSFMGTFMIYRIAGGVDGMRHFMGQFGPSLKWPWTKLMDVPELTPELLDTICSQSDDQAAGRAIRDLERKRDDCLVSVLQSLKTQDFGAGKTLADYEKRLYAQAHAEALAIPLDATQPLAVYETVVAPDWTDYNNHMNEGRYLHVFSQASDALLLRIGVNEAYTKRGLTYYTAETHLVHKQEVAGLEPIKVTVQLLGYDAKRYHIFMTMIHARTGDVLATAEQTLLHVDQSASKVTAAEPQILAKLAEIAQAHAHLSRPADVGRSVRGVT